MYRAGYAKYILSVFLLMLELNSVNAQSLSSTLKAIKINCNKTTEYVDFSTVFRIEFIPLETMTGSLIRKIEKVVVNNDKYVIWDKSQKVIMTFNKNGQFLNRMASVSSPGPGEFTYCYDIDANNGNVYLLSYKSILVFNENLEYRKTIKLKKAYEKFAIVNERAYLYNNDQNPADREKVGFVFLQNGEESHPLLFEHRELGMFNLVEVFNFTRSSDGVLFFYPLTDTIYSILNDKIYPKYILEFGDRKFAKNAFDKIPNDPLSPMKLANSLRETKFAYWPSGFVCNQLGTMFSFSLSDKILYYYKSLSGNQQFLTNGFKIDGMVFNFIFQGYSDNTIITSANPWELTENTKRRIAPGGNNIVEDANPVLIILHKM